ncbi:MAG: peptide-methionine (R)-S-oxide reductase MsrB [bacterium]|nr:peptide-methionine (R)-S-oxide reductase MsrB [bacterium]
MKKTDEEWKKKLTPEQYRILREKGTEAPFAGEYTDTEDEGMYSCAGCGQQLFNSDTKFHSGCGWPSFDQAIKGAVQYTHDFSHGMARTEVTCTGCGGHLGHVFDDGPTETTGKRYCINSVALKLRKQ